LASRINSDMTNPFETIRANSDNQRKSMDWYQRQVRQIASKYNNPAKVFGSGIGEEVNRPEVGSMYMYLYDPKTKDKLPYYDRFPLVLPYDDAKGGFYGLNLHYLPYTLRAQLLGALIETKDSKVIGPDTQMRYNWDLLQRASRFPGVQPTVKRYLYSHIQSKIIKVNPEDWKAAIFLPIEQFQGASKQRIYRDSRARL